MVAVDEGNTVVVGRDPDEAREHLARFSIDGAIFHFDPALGRELGARLHERDARIPALWLLSSSLSPTARPPGVAVLGEPFDVTLIAAFLRFTAGLRIACAASWYARAKRLSAKQSAIFLARALQPEQPFYALASLLGMSDSTFQTQRRRMAEKCGAPLDEAVREATGHIGRRGPVG
jgi:hypothetical protein